MTLNEIKELLAESEKTGQPIQYRGGPQTMWMEAKPDDDLAFIKASHYRVKPAPREWWIHPETGTRIDEVDQMTRPEMRKQAGWIRVREVMED